MTDRDIQQASRTTVLFSGRVQGVGFRYTTRRVARGFAVTGFVRNLSDGRVELVAEGNADEVRRFLGAVEAAMSSNIVEAPATLAAATGEFERFSISR